MRAPHIRLIAATTLLSLLLVACSGMGGAAAPASLDRAEALWQRGDAAAAAREFERRADGNALAAATDYRLRAARAWISRPAP